MCGVMCKVICKVMRRVVCSVICDELRVEGGVKKHIVAIHFEMYE